MYYGHLIQTTGTYLDEESGSNFPFVLEGHTVFLPVFTYYIVRTNTN